MDSISFAFYVSGHGYGHATRASALTSALLQRGHSVLLITNAPQIPFGSVLPPSPSASPSSRAATRPPYATYRNAKVDAGIVQPKAYDVDRLKTVEGLESFLHAREATLAKEAAHLKEQKIQVVLSDSTFLGCAAAAQAGIPSIIVSNFSFDSCYSYLSHPPPPPSIYDPVPEPAIDAARLEPLVQQTISDYSHASLLLRLPGVIPIPAFDTDVQLPSGSWVNNERTSFTPEIEAILSRDPSTAPSSRDGKKIIDIPLIVRPPSSDALSDAFKARLLKSMGVPPPHFTAKVLLVSFGGQSIPRPKSRPPSPSSLALGSTKKKREAGLLPPGWIAIVCGLSGDANEIRNNLPEGFFATEKEKDPYVPDLTAMADVVMGKLGYGTCSECLSVATPLIYVPRPLFIEEFGLKRLMIREGTCVELSRMEFENGIWEYHVLEAYEKSKEGKAKLRQEGWRENGAGDKIVDEIERFWEEEKKK